MNYFNPSYIGPRNDILSLIPVDVQKVLDIGCSIGTLGKQIKQGSNVEVVGIELNPKMATIAKANLDKVITVDIEEIDLTSYFSPGYFDCVIFADILEHLKDPWTVMQKVVTILDEKGLVIASIPNIRHYTTILSLSILGYWPYRDRGIHDKTHLRFFTLKNITELFKQSGLKISKIERNYRIIEKPHPYNKYSKYFAFPMLKDLLTFQYVVAAGK